MVLDSLDLYHQFYIARDDERLGLFRLIARHYPVQRVLYPGSYVHVTPSYVFPEVVYLDTDKKARRFFANPQVARIIDEQKHYPQAAKFIFHDADYRLGIPEPEASFDLLISQFSGFVSLHCRQFLRTGGLLLANDSHGDASMAYLDEAFELEAVIYEDTGDYALSTTDLASYFVRKTGEPVNREELVRRQRGFIYTQTASQYLFRRVR